VERLAREAAHEKEERLAREEAGIADKLELNKLQEMEFMRQRSR
jgi:hypothetical protein